MKQILDIAFVSVKSRIALAQEVSGLFSVTKITSNKESPLYINKDFDKAEKFYNKKIGAY